MKTNSLKKRSNIGFLTTFCNTDLGKAFVPFLVSRILIITVGYFSFYFQPNPDYPMLEEAMRGYGWTSIRFLDMFERFDSGWYLNIIRGGYYLNGEIGKVQNNISFFPLYPLLVKIMSNLKYNPGNVYILFCGILLSNLFFLFSLILFIRLIKVSGFNKYVSNRAIWYICFFPTSFFFSSFYTESLFLFLSIALFYAAIKEKWWLVGLAGYLVSLTRVPGIFTAASALIIYMEKINWDFRKVRWNILWLAMAPLGILTFLISILPITGDLLAPFKGQSAWNHSLSFPWISIFSDLNYRPFITRIDQILVLSFLILSIISIFRLPSKSYGIYCLLSMSTFLFSGSILSASRYILVLFPIFILLGVWGENRYLDRILMVIFSTFLGALMIAWVRFYWVA